MHNLTRGGAALWCSHSDVSTNPPACDKVLASSIMGGLKNLIRKQISGMGPIEICESRNDFCTNNWPPIVTVSLRVIRPKYQ